MRRLVGESILPKLKLEVSDNHVPRAADSVAGWLQETGGLWATQHGTISSRQLGWSLRLRILSLWVPIASWCGSWGTAIPERRYPCAAYAENTEDGQVRRADSISKVCRRTQWDWR